MDRSSNEDLFRPQIRVPHVHEVYGAVFRSIQRLVYYCIHFTLSCMHYTLMLLQSIASFQHSLPYRKLKATQVIEEAKKLTKSPKHMVVIINEDEINLLGVVDILVWSVLSGIPYITVCDSKGKFYCESRP